MLGRRNLFLLCQWHSSYVNARISKWAHQLGYKLINGTIMLNLLFADSIGYFGYGPANGTLRRSLSELIAGLVGT